MTCSCGLCPDSFRPDLCLWSGLPLDVCDCSRHPEPVADVLVDLVAELRRGE